MQVVIYRATYRHLYNLYELPGAVGHNEPIVLSDAPALWITPPPTSSLCLIFQPSGRYLFVSHQICLDVSPVTKTVPHLSTLRLQAPLNAEPIPTNNQPIMDCMIQRQPIPAKYPANAIQHCRWNLRSKTNLYDD